jgi:hypothetical protein
MRDTTEIKNKIINFLENHGPSLPVHISREIKMDMIFTSAFLSELLSEKRISMTKLTIGSSRIYYLKGQEQKLEKIALENLKGKELEAFQKLQQNKFLKNSEQEPALKVALNSIPDFAKKIEKESEIIWKYFLEDSEYQEEILDNSSSGGREEPQNSGDGGGESKTKKSEKEETLEKIVEKPKKKAVKKKTTSTSQKKNEKFFNTVKEYLNSKNIEILDIQTFSKTDLILKVKDNEKELILVCFNKKRITEADILKAHKKAAEEDLNYQILSLGEPDKKTTTFIEAIKALNSIEKIE